MNSKNGFIQPNQNNKSNESETKPQNNEQTQTQATLLTKIDQLDKQLSEKIYNLEINDIFEFVLYLSARLYNPECVTCYFIIMFAYFAKVKQDYFIIFKPVLHVLIILLVTLIMKHLIGRTRPNEKENIKRNFNVRHREKNCSMPSGDAMQSANFAVILIYYFNTYLGIWLIPLVMISRVFYYCHYIMDTIVGAALGWGLSYGLVIILKDV